LIAEIRLGGGLKRCIHTYNDIISAQNLLLAWKEFLRGKRNKKDVQEFQLHLMDNILSLHQDLKNKSYTHGPYYAFNISDPKPRHIHKATVRDRLLHHAIYRILYPYFDKKFISDSYSCRINKGTHRAINQFRKYQRKVSKNNTKQCSILKCDIKKFFASIDHAVILGILKKHIQDRDTIWLLERIITSFETTPNTSRQARGKKGLPLGNLTSQLLVNIYMNEFDQFVKHKLKVKYYIRYADDFVIFNQDKRILGLTLGLITRFLKDNLKLELHPDKLFIKTLSSGIDFLGWVHFPNHRVLRTVTKRRMLKKVSTPEGKRVSSGREVDTLPQVRASYLGMLRHGNAYKLQMKIGLYCVYLILCSL
jgi:retron-type reverse transcriptase